MWLALKPSVMQSFGESWEAFISVKMSVFFLYTKACFNWSLMHVVQCILWNTILSNCQVTFKIEFMKGHGNEWKGWGAVYCCVSSRNEWSSCNKVVEHCFTHGSRVELEFLLLFLQIKEAAIPQVGETLWTTAPHFLVKTGLMEPEFGISDSSAF